MLCYRGMTYCSFHAGCKAGPFCTRSLTDDVRADAARAGLPISQFVDKPPCFDPVEVETKETT